jgi:hypothetical protein
MRVADTFVVTGRGLIVAVEETADLPVGKKLAATVIKRDGSAINADAFKERLLRYSTEPLEGEAFLLIGLAKEDVPVGSELRLTIPD